MVFLFYSICLFIFGNNKKREVEEERREAPLSLSLAFFFSSLFHIVILGSDFCPHTGRERGEERRD